LLGGRKRGTSVSGGGTLALDDKETYLLTAGSKLAAATVAVQAVPRSAARQRSPASSPMPAALPPRAARLVWPDP